MSAAESAEIAAVFVTNPTGAAATWSMFIDADTQTTFNDANALFKARSIETNTTERISLADLPIGASERITLNASAAALRFLFIGRKKSA